MIMIGSPVCVTSDGKVQECKSTDNNLIGFCIKVDNNTCTIKTRDDRYSCDVFSLYEISKYEKIKHNRFEMLEF